MNIYTKEYNQDYGGGCILIAAYTAEQADKLLGPGYEQFDPAEQLEACHCDKQTPQVLFTEWYVE